MMNAVAAGMLGVYGLMALGFSKDTRRLSRIREMRDDLNNKRSYIDHLEVLIAADARVMNGDGVSDDEKRALSFSMKRYRITIQIDEDEMRMLGEQIAELEALVKKHDEALTSREKRANDREAELISREKAVKNASGDVWNEALRSVVEVIRTHASISDPYAIIALVEELMIKPDTSVPEAQRDPAAEQTADRKDE